MSHIAVMGAGSWGTTFAKVLADAGNEVLLYSRRAEQVSEINQERTNSKYLKDIELPDRITSTDDVGFALDGASQVYLSVPSAQLRNSLLHWREFIPSDALLVSLMKGLESETQDRMSQVISDVTGIVDAQLAVLSGPNLALEIALQQPAAAVVACSDLDNAKLIAKTCSNEYFTVFANQDVVGCELGGILKNLIAVSIGIVNGVGHGQNTKASIMTRGLNEITRFAVTLGARRRTMYGLAGLGDLIATSESSLSRNHMAGEMLGKGMTLEQVLSNMSQVAEGLSSVDPVLELARARGVEMPIVEQLAKVIAGEMNPVDFGSQLLTETEEAEIE